MYRILPVQSHAGNGLGPLRRMNRLFSALWLPFGRKICAVGKSC